MITLTNGNFQGPNNIAVPNGSVEFILNVDATVVATPYGIVLANVPVVFQFDANGDIQAGAQLWSNQELNPQNSIGLGTYYLVTFYDQNGARINQVPMWWQFTQVKNSTVDIGQMVPFATVGGNVIFYPTSFGVPTPGPAVLGGIFSNVGGSHQWVSAINTDGTVTMSQPAFTDITGRITNAQLPAVITFTTLTASGLITGQANIELGVIGTLSGQITLDGSTSGQCYITAPAVAGTITNPILFSNSVTLAATCVLTAPGGITIVGTTITAQSGTGGTVAMTASPTFTGTVGAAAITATGTITGATLAATTAITATTTLTTAAQPTFRLTDSELTLSSAVTSVTGGGSVAAVRGATTLATGGTIAAGFIYGVQGKLILNGTLNTANFVAGVFAQLDLSVTQGLGAANVSALWGDMGATISAAVIASGEALLDIMHLTSTAPGSMINSAIHVEALSTYLLDVSNASYPSGWTNTTTVGSQIGRIKIKTPAGDAYIPVYAS